MQFIIIRGRVFLRVSSFYIYSVRYTQENFEVNFFIFCFSLSDGHLELCCGK